MIYGANLRRWSYCHVWGAFGDTSNWFENGTGRYTEGIRTGNSGRDEKAQHLYIMSVCTTTK